jgi:hypothetical protein
MLQVSGHTHSKLGSRRSSELQGPSAGRRQVLRGRASLDPAQLGSSLARAAPAVNDVDHANTVGKNSEMLGRRVIESPFGAEIEHGKHDTPGGAQRDNSWDESGNHEAEVDTTLPQAKSDVTTGAHSTTALIECII